MEKILLIDANALIHRAYHAYPVTLATKEGELTNAVFGFANLLLEIIFKYNPEYVVALFDTGKPTFRHKQYDLYKAHRKPMEEELRGQFPRVHEFLEVLGIPEFSQDGYEADDLIGSLSRSLPKALKKIVVTGDQDLMQLVNDQNNVSIFMSGFNFSGGSELSEKDVLKKYTFPPLAMIDYKSLLGDPSDNIPGVPGIGKKGALELLAQFGSLEKVYESLEDAQTGAVDGENARLWDTQPFKRMRKKLLEGKASGFMSKELATVVTDLKLDFELEKGRLSSYDHARLKEFVQKMEFYSLYNKIEKLPNGNGHSKEGIQRDGKGGNVQDSAVGEIVQTGAALTSGKAPTDKKSADKKSADKQPTAVQNNVGQQSFLAGHGSAVASASSQTASDQQVPGIFTLAEGLKPTELATSSAHALKLIAELSKSDVLAVDTETDSSDYFVAKLVGVGLADKRTSVYIPVGVTNAAVKGALRGLLGINEEPTAPQGSSKSQGALIVGHNLKYDLHVLVGNGFLTVNEVLGLKGRIYDTLLAAYVVKSGELGVSKGLKSLALSELGIAMQDFEQLLAGREIVQVPLAEVANYCGADVQVTLKLYEYFERQLKAAPSLSSLLQKLELPIVPVLVQMEQAGVEIDLEVIADLQKQAEGMLAALTDKIYKQAGEQFNLNSPKQVGEVLFGKLKLHEQLSFQISKTKSGNFSTDERTLMNFAGSSELVANILESRALAKLISTYLKGLPLEVKQDGKIHTSYNQAVASTGRLSSTAPNLQNIPVENELGRQIRRAFKPGKGRVFVAFDYAQQELRLLAHFSGEQKLIDAFARCEDVHALTASQILGVELAEVNKDQRRVGKTVNFGVIYGISAFGLSDRLKIPQKEARQFIEAFYAKYPKIKDYFASLKRQALELGYVETLLGRRRDARAYAGASARQAGALERELLNFPLQGSAADIMKLAMIEVADLQRSDNEFASYGAVLHLQVHDELIFSLPKELPERDTQKFIVKIVKTMSEVQKLSVPLLVDAEIGEDWYSLEKL
jgi:DNA polymerase-1